jgi:hypothetical protein
MSEWLQELMLEHRKEMRQGIVQAIRGYCHKTGTPHREVWRAVYARLAGETGLDLSRPARTKLDLVEEADQLGTLSRIVRGYEQ